MKYAKHLQAVHPSLQPPGHRPERLMDVIHAAKTADEVQSYVRRALRFNNEGDGRTPEAKRYKRHAEARHDLDSVRFNQVTTCIGYAIVSSECLSAVEEQVGPHYLMFVNKHALRVLVNGETIRITDFTKPSIDTTLTSRQDVSASTLLQDIYDPAHPRGTMRLNANTFASKDQCVDQLIAKNSWLYAGNRDMRLQSGKQIRDIDRGLLLIASVFEASRGRQIFEDFTDFRAAVDNSDLPTALNKLQKLDGLYPEIDARSSHNYIERLVGSLGLEGSVVAAEQAITWYTNSFVRSKDPRLAALEAKLYAICATSAGSSELAIKAIGGYEKAASESRHSWQPTAWRHAANKLRHIFGVKMASSILT